MLLENRFLFIGKVFIVIFLIINSVNFFPVKINNVFYYINIFNVLLDTTTLLLLGLAIPRFLFIKKIHVLGNIKIKKPDELEEINGEIYKFQKSADFNYNLAKICSVLFLVVFLSQPINLLFVLNRSDIMINQTINSLSKSLELRKKQVLDSQKSIFENKINQDFAQEKKVENQQIFESLDTSFDQVIDNAIKKNNVQKFNTIKLIIRNIFMSLIWAFAFFKLSKINYQK